MPGSSVLYQVDNEGIATLTLCSNSSRAFRNAISEAACSSCRSLKASTTRPSSSSLFQSTRSRV